MSGLRFASLARGHWLAFFGALGLAWLALFRMAVPGDLGALERAYGGSLVDLLCSGGFGASGFGPVFAMWALMSAAMMAPTALPAFAAYDDLGHATATRFGRLVAGYLTAWLGFAAIAAGAQVALARLGLVGALGQSLSAPLTMLLLIGAGLYQFSPLKGACLSRCRAPLSFFLQFWDEGPFRNGLRLGLDCVGCCWALMALGFVGGTMNLAFMGLAMLLMMLEKLPDPGRHLTRPLGALLIASGAAVPFL